MIRCADLLALARHQGRLEFRTIDDLIEIRGIARVGDQLFGRIICIPFDSTDVDNVFAMLLRGFRLELEQCPPTPIEEAKPPGTPQILNLDPRREPQAQDLPIEEAMSHGGAGRLIPEGPPPEPIDTLGPSPMDLNNPAGFHPNRVSD